MGSSYYSEKIRRDLHGHLHNIETLIEFTQKGLDGESFLEKDAWNTYKIDHSNFTIHLTRLWTYRKWLKKSVIPVYASEVRSGFNTLMREEIKALFNQLYKMAQMCYHPSFYLPAPKDFSTPERWLIPEFKKVLERCKEHKAHAISHFDMELHTSFPTTELLAENVKIKVSNRNTPEDVLIKRFGSHLAELWSQYGGHTVYYSKEAGLAFEYTSGSMNITDLASGRRLTNSYLNVGDLGTCKNYLRGLGACYDWHVLSDWLMNAEHYFPLLLIDDLYSKFRKVDKSLLVNK